MGYCHSRIPGRQRPSLGANPLQIIGVILASIELNA